MERTIGMGGGCHWCTEAIFQSLKGVKIVEQGWISSINEHSSFSEAVRITFNPQIISLETLIEIHLLSHSSTSSHSMRGKYRSAIYYSENDQKAEIEAILFHIQHESKSTFVTQILELKEFKLNTEEFLNYYQKRPNAPFCQTYISPKLSMLRKQFGKIISDPN